MQYLDLYPNVTIEGRRTYNAMASTVDDACKNITDALKAAGMWDDSLCVGGEGNVIETAATSAVLTVAYK